MFLTADIAEKLSAPKRRRGSEMATRLSVMTTAYAQKRDLSYTEICKEMTIFYEKFSDKETAYFCAKCKTAEFLRAAMLQAAPDFFKGEK